MRLGGCPGLDILADESLPTHSKGRAEKLVAHKVQEVDRFDGRGLGEVVPSVRLIGNERDTMKEQWREGVMRVLMKMR